MSIEQITPAEKAASDEALAKCIAGKAQTSAQTAEDILKKAEDIKNKAFMKMAKIPEELIASLNEAIEVLMKIINGWEDPSLKEMDPDAIIAKLEALLNPVVDTLVRIVSEVGLPEIPGLKQIADLLAALKTLKPIPKPAGWEGAWPTDAKRPEIPREMKRMMQDLLIAIQSLSTTLPMVLVNILFNTVDLILGVQIPVVGMSFYTILGAIPFIKQIPELVQLAPKISDLVVNAAGKLGNIVEGKLMQMVQQMQDLSVPPAPSSTMIPKELPACPQRDS